MKPRSSLKQKLKHYYGAVGAVSWKKICDRMKYNEKARDINKPKIIHYNYIFEAFAKKSYHYCFVVNIDRLKVPQGRSVGPLNGFDSNAFCLGPRESPSCSLNDKCGNTCLSPTEHAG